MAFGKKGLSTIEVLNILSYNTIEPDCIKIIRSGFIPNSINIIYKKIITIRKIISSNILRKIPFLDELSFLFSVVIFLFPL